MNEEVKENIKYRCPKCNYPYSKYLSGIIYERDGIINSDGNLELDICCEDCGTSLILIVTETRVKE